MSLSFLSIPELFNKCIKESFFPDCWKVSSVVPVFKNFGERSTAKNYHSVSLLSVISKVFEKLVNNRIVDRLEKCGLFSDFHMVLGLLSQLQIFSQLHLIELLELLTDLGLVLDISNAFDRVWYAGLLHRRKYYGISGQIFGLISSFLSNRWLRVVLDGKSSREYPVNPGVSQRSILGPILFLLYINDLPDLLYINDPLLSMLMILPSILSVIRNLICGNNLNWLLNLNLIYETLWTWVRSGLLISMLGKLSWSRLTGLMTMVLLI